MNHVFVDFENVPSVDLALIGEKDAEVTLLIGEKQRRLELGLVRQIHEHATKVTLVEVGASGRNALDLVLAWHLGKTAERHADDPYFVVSKDKDFNPLIAHLRTRGLKIERVDSFAELPFLARRPRPRRTPSEPAVARRVPPAAVRESRRPPEPPPARESLRRSATPSYIQPEPPDERLMKLIDRLQHRTKARPARRKALLSHINQFYGNQLGEPQLDEIVATLEQRGVLALDEKGRVTYP